MFNSVIYNWKLIDSEDKGLISFSDPSPDGYDGMYFNKEYKWQLRHKNNESMIKFIYRDRQYEEINFARDFGFESFWSGIGGFVGIFIGLRQAMKEMVA